MDTLHGFTTITICFSCSCNTSLVTQTKPNIVNIWPKINTLISSFNFFKGGYGVCRENYDPHGLPYGLGCHFPPGVGGGVLPMWLFQNVKMALGFNFCF